jgi:putative DNA methylase
VPPRGTIETPCERLVTIDYHCARCPRNGSPTHRFKAPGRGDVERLRRAERLCADSPSRFWPSELIPAGKETDRLLRWGYLRWRDLFSPRQSMGWRYSLNASTLSPTAR